jgi:hypothetical protein
VEDLAKTLAMAYTLREERVTQALNEECQSEPPTPSSSSLNLSTRFKFGKDEDPAVLGRRITPPAPSPAAANGTSRWTRGFFKNNSSSQVNLNVTPKTPPPQETAGENTGGNAGGGADVPSKFSPGAWGASLSAASRKLNKLRLTPGTSSESSPSSSKTAVALDDRQQTPTTSAAGTAPATGTISPSPLAAVIKGGTSTITSRMGAIRDSFERRNEIIQKVGGWVANTHESPRSSTDWEEVDVPNTKEGSDSRAAEEIKRLESELRKKEELTPEEYIARIKKRREDKKGRESKDFQEVKGGGLVGGGDPLGVEGV